MKKIMDMLYASFVILAVAWMAGSCVIPYMTHQDMNKPMTDAQIFWLFIPGVLFLSFAGICFFISKYIAKEVTFQDVGNFINRKIRRRLLAVGKQVIVHGVILIVGINIFNLGFHSHTYGENYSVIAIICMVIGGFLCLWGGIGLYSAVMYIFLTRGLLEEYYCPHCKVEIINGLPERNQQSMCPNCGKPIKRGSVY